MTDVVAAREQARRANGEFGTQEHAEQTGTLLGGLGSAIERSDDWIRGFNDSYCGAWVDGYNTGWEDAFNGNSDYGDGANAGSDARDDAQGNRYMATTPAETRFDGRAESTAAFPLDFGPCHRHTNPNGSIGGWVADTATVSDDSYVGPNALVLDEAKVLDGAQIVDNAIVRDYAEVSGGSCVSHDAVVSGYAKVSGRSELQQRAWVTGESRVEGGSGVYNNAIINGGGVFGDSSVQDNAHVRGSIQSKSLVGGEARIDKHAVVDSAAVFGDARVCESAVISAGVVIRGSAIVEKKTQVSGRIILDDGRILGNIRNAITSGGWSDTLDADSGVETA